MSLGPLNAAEITLFIFTMCHRPTQYTYLCMSMYYVAYKPVSIHHMYAIPRKTELNINKATRLPRDLPPTCWEANTSPDPPLPSYHIPRSTPALISHTPIHPCPHITYPDPPLPSYLCPYLALFTLTKHEMRLFKFWQIPPPPPHPNIFFIQKLLEN